MAAATIRDVQRRKYIRYQSAAVFHLNVDEYAPVYTFYKAWRFDNACFWQVNGIAPAICTAVFSRVGFLPITGCGDRECLSERSSKRSWRD